MIVGFDQVLFIVKGPLTTPLVFIKFFLVKAYTFIEISEVNSSISLLLRSLIK
jgi:hypothetical protein